MKRTLFVIACVLASLAMPAQDELTVEDIQNSGCLNETRGTDSQRVPTIVLKKEGSALSVQLLNYEENCCAEDFNVTSSISGSTGGLCSVSINVAPVGDDECDCICPYNVSFTLRDLEANTFYLKCWWYEGLVELTEGQSYQATYGGSFYSYHPFLKEGKTWNYQEYYHNLWDNQQWTKEVSYVINGTTEIDGKTYYKMYRISEEGSNYYCALREEGRKVWQYFSDEGDHLIYDLGMSVGDSYRPSYEPFYFQLSSIKPMWFHDDQLLNVLLYDIWTQDIPSEPAINVASTPIVEGVGCENGWNIIDYFAPQPPNGIIFREQFLSCYEDGKCLFTADDFNNLTTNGNIAYRPTIEDGKVWVVKVASNSWPTREEWTEFYYLEGDTIVNGQNAKRMLCDRVYATESENTYGEYVGACYEQDKKVYYSFFKGGMQFDFEQLYDFTLSTNDSITMPDGTILVVNKWSGEIPGFKGTCYDFWLNWDDFLAERWLEGVGSESWPWNNHPRWLNGNIGTLLTCSVGDEVIYYNSEVEDPFIMEARKGRFDFTHTVKTKPKAPIKREKSDACISSSEREVVRPEVKAPMRRETEQSLYGEYNEQQLGIYLDPVDDAYLVRITDETGKIVYEKAINAGNIVALNIDISTYAEGRYTVTVENSQEIFTGEFETQTTGIEENLKIEKLKDESIYNLQGQRLSSLQKGLNIVNGQKVYIK